LNSASLIFLLFIAVLSYYGGIVWLSALAVLAIVLWAVFGFLSKAAKTGGKVVKAEGKEIMGIMEKTEPESPGLKPFEGQAKALGEKAGELAFSNDSHRWTMEKNPWGKIGEACKKLVDDFFEILK